MSESAEEPKLIVDEDWKTQVQREKEEFELKKKQAESNEAPAPPTNSDSLASDSATDNAQETTAAPASSQSRAQSLPPASFAVLTTTLGAQAMGSMGLLPGDDGQTLPVNLDFAKHFIDLLGMLEEKTQGNLTPEESHLLQETLYQLRMAFVEVKKRT